MADLDGLRSPGDFFRELDGKESIPGGAFEEDMGGHRGCWKEVGAGRKWVLAELPGSCDCASHSTGGKNSY
jgi:hypothetical protein